MIPAESATSETPGSAFSWPNGHFQGEASSVVLTRGKSLKFAQDASDVVMPSSLLVSVASEGSAQARQAGGRLFVVALNSPCLKQGFAFRSMLLLARGVSALSSLSLSECVSVVAASASVLPSSPLVSVASEG